MPYLTPEEIPAGDLCRPLSIPHSGDWLAIVSGALTELTKRYNWEQQGAVTVDEAVARMQTMIDDYYAGACAAGGDYPTPFWDEAQDVDDELPIEEQPWYGEVPDPDAPPEELTWQENASIWLITGFIAYSGQIGAAIFFNTIAPRVVLAFNKGDLRELWRVVVDASDYAQIDTDDYGIDDIIELVVLGDPENETHDILIVKVEP